MFLHSIKGDFIAPIALFCFLVAFSRIVVGVHYPLDVIGGCVVGSLIGYVIAQVYKTTIKTLGTHLDRRI